MNNRKRNNVGRVVLFHANDKLKSRGVVLSGYIETPKGRTSIELYREPANTEAGEIFKGVAFTWEEVSQQED